MAAAVGILTSSFNDAARSSYQSSSTRGPERAARAAEKLKKREPKKVKKKLVRTSGLPLEGNFERQMPSFRCSKKIEKSGKKSLSGP
jgi:hypothetical protein